MKSLKIIAFLTVIFTEPLIAQEMRDNGIKTVANNSPELSQIEFTSSQDWYLVDGLRLPTRLEKDSLIFRRFYLYSVNDEIQAELGLANVINVTCRNKRPGSVIIHIPDSVELRTVGRDQWISRTELRVLADDAGLRFEAEYIKGDFFVDFTPDSAEALKHMIKSRRVTVEFGPKSERIQLYQSDTASDGKGDLKGLIGELVPMMAKSFGGKNIRRIDGDMLFAVCARYAAGD